MAPAIMAHPDLRSPFQKADLKPGEGATVLYGNKTTTVQTVLQESGLWVSEEDLTRINGFVIKPEGACLEELCVPLKQRADILKTVAGKQWFNLAAFAELMAQPWVRDEDTNSWSFGDFPAIRQAMLTEAQAPDFEVMNRQGEVVRMADYKGKKALIVTWSSW